MQRMISVERQLSVEIQKREMLVFLEPSGIALQQRWLTFEQGFEGWVESGQPVLRKQWVDNIAELAYVKTQGQKNVQEVRCAKEIECEHECVECRVL